MPINEAAQVNVWPRGYNGAFTFGGGGSGGIFFVRMNKIAHSWEVVATESHARIHRAMYPRQRAISKFAVQIELKGYRESKQFYNFMKAYIDSYMTVQQQGLLVLSAIRNFSRWGVPIKGVSDGDHTGSNVFAPVIIFESINDPADQVIYTPQSGAISDETLNGVSGDQAKFFYPFSIGSRSAGVRAETLYDFDRYSGRPPVGEPTEGPIGGAPSSGRRGGGGRF